MADITSTIRFIADASQAIGTMRNLASEAQALNRSVANIQANIIKQQTGSDVFAQKRTQLGLPANTLINLPATSVIDQFNKTLRTTHDAIVLNDDGMEIFRTTLSNATGDIRVIESAVRQYTTATKIGDEALTGVTQRLENQRTALGNLLAPSRQRIADIQSEKAALKDLLQTQIDTRLRLPNPQPINFKSSAEDLAVAQARHTAIAVAEDRIAETEAALRSVYARQGAATRSAAQFERTDPIVLAAKARVSALEQLLPETERAASNLVSAAARAIEQGVALPPPIPAALQTVQRESPDLFNRLVRKSGLGIDQAGNFTTKQLYESGADQLQVTRDLERGTTSLRGSFRALTGEIVNVNAAYREGGTVIGRYGGTLSGVQNFLRQTVNNFQKVVQWGAATTAVFAGLGLATSAINTVKTLDASLNQLGITAQLSSRQTGEVFDDLAQIAFNTSTPLAEMVKAADDIALATKRANQSTVEWQGNIKSLANSVGILTNITGLDTVRATDLLTSTMKQLNLTARDLPSILNKAAAVGGGQANSITDIVSGLGAMAEAADQANLSIDQTIGVVQVLGQVTSKSSTEIATAFKNLVGSVDSAGAQKAFEKYGISIKDTEGNLRNILDIYDEINQKIASGVIPESDVKALVKAIAGGPRRAPDAAALLANVDAIKQAAERAGQATNEALIANAKYLDTIESKITQIQVKFDTFVQKAFGPAIKGFVNDLASTLGGVLDFLSKLDPALIKGVLGLAAFVAGFKVLSATFNFFKGGFLDIVGAIGKLNYAEKVATDVFRLTGTTAEGAAAQIVSANAEEIASLDALILAHSNAAKAAAAQGEAELAASEEAIVAAGNFQKAALAQREAALAGTAGPTVAAGGAAGFLQKYGKYLGVGLGAAAGAGFGQLTGTSVLGGALLGGGLSGFAIDPTPFKALSLAAIAAGTALTFFSGESKTAKDVERDTGVETLSLINKYKDAQQSISDLSKTQATALQDVSNIINQGSAKNVDLLNSKVIEYGIATINLEKANQSLAESFTDLQKATHLDTDFGSQIAAARAGTLNPAVIKQLQEKIYKQIFADIYPDLSKQSTPVNNRILSGPGLTGTGTQASASYTGTKFDTGPLGLGFLGSVQKVPVQEVFDLKNLKQASDILKLFSEDGQRLTGTFDHSAEAVDLIRHNLQETVDANNEFSDRARVALDTFNGIAAQMDNIAQLDLFTKQQDTLLQVKTILGQIGSEAAKQGQANLAVYGRLIELAQQLPDVRQSGAQFTTPRAEAELNARRLLLDKEGNIRTSKLGVDEARALAQQLGILDKLGTNVKVTDEAIAEILLQGYGIETQISAEKKKQIEDIEAAQKLEEAFNATRQDALDNLASKSGDIQRKFLSGDITKSMRDSMLKGAQATKALEDRVTNLIQSIAGNQPVLDKFKETMAKIPGLENLAGASASDAATLLVKYFESMNLTEKGAKVLTTRIVQLIAALEAIPKDTLINIRINTQYTSRADFIATEGNSPDARDQANKAFSSATTSAAKQYSSLQKQINSLISQIQHILGGGGGNTFLGSTGSKSGSGGSGGGSTRTATPPDVSELDLPDEIANAQNRSALIAEAIRRARALQHLIPGADKEASNDIVELLKGTQRILEVRGVKDDYLRKALEELAAVEKKRLEFETKADTIRRIRVGAGDFAALANVPLNTQTGVSVGSPNGPITVNLNINGQVLTPAQFASLADQIAAAIKRQIAG